ncbi:hypothetical protein ACFVUT_18345 [Streptomyces sp. NPDC058051]|uniref:hypothetical protein n=1 Tax=Streptomyces sp. NPDC058051 TaxID=3346315 RepID=UPI0036E65526
MVVLVALFRPDGSGGPDADSKGAGGQSPAAVAAKGAAAAKALAALPGVRLSAAYRSSGGETEVRADLTVTSDGEASGTLRMPVTGRAAMAWSADQLYLKGDDDFWAQQGPHYGKDLSSSSHWVAPVKRDGYYMLDSFGVNAGSLNPASLASLVREVTSDPSVVQEDVESVRGRKATSYAARDWTVVLADAAPHTVLAIGISPARSSPVKSASWRHTAGGRVLPAVHRMPSDDSDRYSNPYLNVILHPATGKEAKAVRVAAGEAKTAAVPPLTSAEKVKNAQGPVFTTSSDDAYLCTSKPCSYSYTVTNEGDEPAEATLHVSFPGIPDRAHPLGVLAPGKSRTVSGTRPNAAAGTGSTVRHVDPVWVYSYAYYGPDPEVGRRLHARNLKPDDVFVATPLKPAVAKLLDLMTKNAAGDDTKANEVAVAALRSADNRGQLPLLAAIAQSGRLSNIKDLAANVIKANKMDNPGDIRVLEQVAHLMVTDPNTEVTYDGAYEINGEKYKADYITVSRKGGEEIKKAFQVKAASSRRNLPDHVDKGGEQLNGEAGASGSDGLAENAPPGFRRVLQIYLEPNLTDLFHQSKADLESSLFETRKWAKVRENLCKQRADKQGPRIEELVIVNGAGNHVWADLSKLCTPTADHTR